MKSNGSPASPAPPKQPHSPAILAQLSKHVVQSVHIQRVPGKWQSAQTLQELTEVESLKLIKTNTQWPKDLKEGEKLVFLQKKKRENPNSYSGILHK